MKKACNSLKRATRSLSEKSRILVAVWAQIDSACYEQDFPPVDDQPTAVAAAERAGFVGEDHLARFVLALVLEDLDLGEIEAAYASERGQPPFDPAMMTRSCCTAIATASTRRAGSPRRRASGSTS